MFYISEFGIKIKNISAGMLYDVNLGIRDYFTYTDAMLNNSLFSFYLQRNGLNVYRGKKDVENSKNESTRDIVCLDFDFGSRSYDEEFKRLSKLLDEDFAKSRKNIEADINTLKGVVAVEGVILKRKAKRHREHTRATLCKGYIECAYIE